MRKELSAKEYKEILVEIGVSYLGCFSQSAKLIKNQEVANVITYNINLMPWNWSGHQVCACGEHCHFWCLNGSGRNCGDTIMRGFEGSIINRARIKKTKLFFEDRDTFLNLMYYEIRKTQRYAETRGYGFSIRVNCTSDLNLRLFMYDGEHTNILDEFPDVQFYDYTKVPANFDVSKEYKNYYMVASFDGYNHKFIRDVLENGGNVAVVFEQEAKNFPIAYRGYPVIDGTKTDLIYTYPQGGYIVGLEMHRTASMYDKGRFIRPDTPFIIKEDDPACTYAKKVGIEGIDE